MACSYCQIGRHELCKAKPGNCSCVKCYPISISYPHEYIWNGDNFVAIPRRLSQ